VFLVITLFLSLSSSPTPLVPLHSLFPERLIKKTLLSGSDNEVVKLLFCSSVTKWYERQTVSYS